MPLNGTLRDWNAERGYGFITPVHGGAAVFVHVSAFPRDGGSPVVGEKLRYELERGRDGRPQAVRVVRLDARQRHGGRAAHPVRKGSGSGWFGTAVAIALAIAMVAFGFQHFTDGNRRRELAAQPPTSSVPAAATEGAAPFRCDGRTRCSQMTSCAEATWFINNCPGTQMDGNHDGIPCETQWCTGPTSR